MRQHHRGEQAAEDRPHILDTGSPDMIASAREALAIANMESGSFLHAPLHRSTGVTLPPELAPAGSPRKMLALEEFVTASEFRRIVGYALEQESSFQPSLMLDSNRPAAQVDETRRKSTVLIHPVEIGALFRERITSVLPFVLRQFGLPALEIRRIDVQITATNDNEFFLPHVDNFSESVRTRRLSFVYFFHREPKAFSGGELRIFDLTRNDPVARLHASFTEVAPAQNQIVFFPSGLLHEIAAVECPSRAFEDGRFTVNGWIYQ